MKKEHIKKNFDKHGGIMRTKELSENGIYYRKLKRLMEEGKVVKIRYGYYQLQDGVFNVKLCPTRIVIHCNMPYTQCAVCIVIIEKGCFHT